MELRLIFFLLVQNYIKYETRAMGGERDILAEASFIPGHLLSSNPVFLAKQAQSFVESYVNNEINELLAKAETYLSGLEEW